MILEVSGVAAGGAVVGRAPDGRVVFVRYALPGETVRVEVTSEGAKFLRADAVEVLSAAPSRVEPPCPWFGTCGGCDWQHTSDPLPLKTALVQEQLQRIGGFTWEGAVEAVEPVWGWRTRTQWAGGVGFHRHRSSDVVAVDRCLISADPFPPGPADGVVEVMAGAGPHGARVEVLGRRFEVAAGGFWQVHVAAPTVLASAVLDGLAPVAGERVADLYAGVGLFACLLGDRVGPSGSVLAIEASARGCADAARNSDDQPWVRVRTSPVTPSLVSRLDVDLVVLDPPRAGAGLEVTRALSALRPRAVAYVSCDAASFARDLKVLLDAGWTVGSLRVLDLFPQTEHVEIVSVLMPPAQVRTVDRVTSV